MDYFYDGQTRRYLLQFMRIFSDIKIENGPDENGVKTQQRVPIMYGDPSFIVAQIIKGGSENTAMPAPMFSAYIDSLSMAPERRQDPQYVGKINGIEREFSNGAYGSGTGNRFQIERYMPVPYTLQLKLDLWTTTTTHKLQIAEQILTIFNPMIQLQQNTNIFDWTSIFEVELMDVQWTNRNVPSGTELQRDVISFKFKLPVWLNPPAKVKRTTLISEIVTNVFYGNVDEAREHSNAGMYDPVACVSGNPTQIIVTPGNHRIKVSNTNGQDEVLLLNKYGAEETNTTWSDLFAAYGKIQDNVTTMRLKLAEDIEDFSEDIIGYIQQDAQRPNVLLFSVDADTLPQTTLPSVLGIVDVQEVMPGSGIPGAIAGQRYIVAGEYTNGEESATTEQNSSTWGDLVAYEGDVIEYTGTQWDVIFSASNATTKQYIMNLSDGKHYTFENGAWSYTYYAVYFAGYWRIDNLILTQDSYLPDTGYDYRPDIL